MSPCHSQWVPWCAWTKEGDLTTRTHDVAVIGAGIVGLATAFALERRFPGLDVLVVEKEGKPGQHQTGHNSGVIHSGLYYRPGSLKARLCVEGRQRMLEFCEEAGVPVGSYGKLVIATREAHRAALETLWERGRANGLSGLEKLGPDGIRSVEPHATGIAALWVPETGVTDFAAVAERIGDRLGGMIQTDTKIDSISFKTEGVQLGAGEKSFDAKVLVNCAGLHADRIARLAGVNTSIRIVPFRGEYYTLRRGSEDLVNGLIYPVPDPRFPFLGVHFTRKLNGTVEVGPNAVLALAREHYRGTPPSVRDLWDMMSFPGFWRVVGRYWRTGTEEMWHSLRVSSYARQARSLVPDLRDDDLEKSFAGVRAQAVARDGRLLDDFEIITTDNTVHVLNAPSPAATSSLAIGEHIANLVGDTLRR